PSSTALFCTSRPAAVPASSSCAATMKSPTVAVLRRLARSMASVNARTCAPASCADSLPDRSATNARAAASSSAGDPCAPAATLIANARAAQVLISPPAEEPRDTDFDRQLALQLGAAPDAAAVEKLAHAEAQQEVVGKEDALADAYAAAEREPRRGARGSIRSDALEQHLGARRDVRIEVDRLLARERQLSVDGRPSHLEPGHHADVAGRRAKLPGLGVRARSIRAHVDRRRKQRRATQRMAGKRPALVQVTLEADSREDAPVERIADGELHDGLELEPASDAE